MFKNKRVGILLAIFAAIIFLSGCQTISTGVKSISDMTPKEKVTWMYGVYNSQYSNYQAMTGYTWNDVEKKWEKTSFPTLSEDQKEILRKRKDVLTEVYPLIKLYDSMVVSGTSPGEEAIQKIVELLNELLLLM